MENLIQLEKTIDLDKRLLKDHKSFQSLKYLQDVAIESRKIISEILVYFCYILLDNDIFPLYQGVH